MYYYHRRYSHMPRIPLFLVETYLLQLLLLKNADVINISNKRSIRPGWPSAQTDQCLRCSPTHTGALQTTDLYPICFTFIIIKVFCCNILTASATSALYMNPLMGSKKKKKKKKKNIVEKRRNCS